MAMMRQIGKQMLTIAGLALAAAFVGVPFPVAAETSRADVVVDPLSGIAIDGYDAVSYFSDGEPLAGRSDYEFYWHGVPWYFASAANRDVFMRAPEIYAPQHGGHCQMSLARGYLSDGKPRIFAIYGAKLYLFYSVDNREAFLRAPEQAVHSAEGNWVDLSRGLPAN